MLKTWLLNTKTNIKTKKIDKLTLKIYKMVITRFQI